MRPLITGLLLICAGAFSVMAAAYAVAGLLGPIGGRVAIILFLNLIAVMVIATLLTMAERKWSALLQNRIGPNRIRVTLPLLGKSALSGLPHIIPDVLKLLTKEVVSPKSASRLLFNLAPMLAFGPVFCLFVIVPAGPSIEMFGTKVVMAGASPDFGILFVFAVASLAVYGTSLAGWASNNRFALLGGVRASSQLISYEVALGLSLVGLMLAFSTVALSGETGMVAQQAKYLWEARIGALDVGIPQWGFLLQPVGFFLFLAAAFAETKRTPFDTPEGESEIVGYFLEYSGMQFGLFMVAEFVEVVVLSGILVSVFFGGWSLPFGNEWLRGLSLMQAHPWVLGAFYGMVFWLKVGFFCVVQLIIRWTFPRFRYDQIQRLGWQILLPLGLLNLFLSGALILWDPSLRALAVAGAIELAILAFYTLTPANQVRESEPVRDRHAVHDPISSTSAATH